MSQKNLRHLTFPIVIAALAAVPSTVLAQKAASTGGAKPAAGQAAGTMSVAGKSVKLAFAAAFVDQKDDRKPVLLVLSNEKLPAETWASEFDLMSYLMDHKFSGVCFFLDKNREAFRSDYYWGDEMPTSTSGIFDLKLDPPAGNSFVGSAKSTAQAAKQRTPVKLDVVFNAVRK